MWFRTLLGFPTVFFLAVAGLALGVVSLWLAMVNGFDYARWAVGLAFVYFFSGFPLSLLVLPRAESFLERVFVSVAASLFLTYPAGFLNSVFEGQSGQAIFGYHLIGSLSFLLLLNLLFLVVVFWQNPKLLREDSGLSPRSGFFLLLPILAAVIFNFYQLNRADLIGDEYDLGYQAYNLVDGIVAGRKAYTLSFSAHPPLPMYVQHFTMQVLEPRGLDFLSDWMFRFGPAIFGVLTVLVIFGLVEFLTGSTWTALLAGILLATNTYHVFLSRVFQREGFLTFFLGLFLYWLVRFQKDYKASFLRLAAFSVGLAMLVKTTAVVAVVAGVIYLFVSRVRNWLRRVGIFLIVTGLLFLPVVVYNVGAYLTTGYTDIFFARIFHTKTHPGASMVESDVFVNLVNLKDVLSDQYGWFLLFAFGLSELLALRQKGGARIVALFIALSIAAFLGNGIRYYYLSFLSAALVVVVTVQLAYLARKWPAAAILLGTVLVVYSAVYAASTFFGVRPVFGRSILVQTTLTDHGWKKIAAKLSASYRPGDCLVAGEGVTNLPLRRYLQTDDEIKKYYLGKNYPHYYKMCDEVATPSARIGVFINQAGQADLTRL